MGSQATAAMIPTGSGHWPSPDRDQVGSVRCTGRSPRRSGLALQRTRKDLRARGSVRAPPHWPLEAADSKLRGGPTRNPSRPKAARRHHSRRRPQEGRSAQLVDASAKNCRDFRDPSRVSVSRRPDLNQLFQHNRSIPLSRIVRWWKQGLGGTAEVLSRALSDADPQAPP